MFSEIVYGRQGVSQLFGHLVSRSVCRHAERLAVVPYRILNIRPVCRLAEDDADGRIFVRLLNSVVKRLQIEVQLSEVDGLERTLLEFHGHERVEFAVEEQEVDEVFMPRRLDAVLVADE